MISKCLDSKDHLRASDFDFRYLEFLFEPLVLRVTELPLLKHDS